VSAFADEDAVRQSADVGYPRDPSTGSYARRRVFARLQVEKLCSVRQFYKKYLLFFAFINELDGNIPEIRFLNSLFP
jgi:hypothetical protein